MVGSGTKVKGILIRAVLLCSVLFLLVPLHYPLFI